jgi:hypothetical protein
MRSFIVVTEDGKRHAVIDSNIKSVEHVPGTPGTPAQAKQEAREGHPGEPAVAARSASPGVAAHPSRLGKPPVKAQEAKEAVRAIPGVPDSVIIHFVDGESLTVKNLSQQQVVDLINRPWVDTVGGNIVHGTPGTSERATHQDARAEERENLSQRQALEANNERQPAEEQRRRDEDASMAREAEDKARFGAPATAAHQANPNQQ